MAIRCSPHTIQWLCDTKIFSDAQLFVTTLNRLCFETSSNHHSDHGANDGSGHEFGKPMDGHRDAEADVECIEQREEDKHPIFRIEHDQADRHGKRNGGVRRRPAPKDAAFEETELETVAGINQRSVGSRRHSEASEWWREASGECLVAARYKVAENGRLSQSPCSRDDTAVFSYLADNQDDQNYQHRQHGSEHDGRAGKPEKRIFPRRKIIRPVEAGHDDHHRQDNGQRVP